MRNGSRIASIRSSAAARAGRIHVERQDHELVAAHAGDGVFAQGAAYALRHFDQQQIAHVMAVDVVDGLEAVQVQEHQRESQVLSRRARAAPA